MAPRKVNKTTPKPSMLTTQRTKVKAAKLEAGPATVRGGQAPGAGRTSPSAPKPKPKPAVKPVAKDSRQPRALTNTKSATMRQIRAKAVQARRQAQGKTTVASRNPGIAPDSAQGQRIRTMAQGQRVMGDSGQVRAAQQRGKAEVAKAQARRGAKAASQRMAGKLAKAGAVRALRNVGKLTGRAGLFYEGIQANNTAKGTLEEAKKKYGAKAMPQKQGPAAPKTTQSSFNKKSFDDAFRSARSSGAKEFTWRGKRYNTKIKGAK